MKLVLCSILILLGIALIVLAPITGEFRPLVGGIVVTAIASWSLVKQLRKCQVIKQSDFEQTLDAIKQNEQIKL